MKPQQRSDVLAGKSDVGDSVGGVMWDVVVGCAGFACVDGHVDVTAVGNGGGVTIAVGGVCVSIEVRGAARSGVGALALAKLVTMFLLVSVASVIKSTVAAKPLKLSATVGPSSTSATLWWRAATFISIE